MTYIVKETPSGVIDGENKIFSFSYEIKELDDLWLDGAIYTDFVIDGKNVILAHAPKKSLFGDYFTYDIEAGTSTKYISKEKPDGRINGENKVFQLKSDVYKVDDIWLDGAVYTAYTIDGRILTLEDAPKVSLFIDYYGMVAVKHSNTSITFLDIKNEVWRLIGQKSTSKNFGDEYIGMKINSVASNIWNGHVTNLLDHKDIIRSGDMSFQNSSFSFRSKVGGSLTKESVAGDIKLKANTTNLYDKGWAKIGSDIIQYSKKSDGLLEGVIGTSINHFAGEKVEQLYEVREDFSKGICLKKIVANYTGIDEMDIPFLSGKTSFNILEDSRTGTKLLKINSIGEGEELKLDYIRAYTKMYNDKDLCPFPGDYGLSVLAILTAGVIAQENCMPMASVLLAIAYPNLKTMYSYFSSELKNTKQKLRPKSYTFESVR